MQWQWRPQYAIWLKRLRLNLNHDAVWAVHVHSSDCALDLMGVESFVDHCLLDGPNDALASMTHCRAAKSMNLSSSYAPGWLNGCMTCTSVPLITTIGISNDCSVTHLCSCTFCPGRALGDEQHCIF